MRTTGCSRLLAAALLIILLASPILASLQAQAASPLQVRGGRDRREVAIDTIRFVIEGLKQLRDYLSKQNVPPEALTALDMAVKNLESTIQVLRETGDVGAADAALKISSRQSGEAARAGPREKGEEGVTLRRAIERAQERAAELASEVNELKNQILKQELTGMLQRAEGLLGQALQALSNNDVDRAARLLGEAVDILGRVNSQLAMARGEERLSRAGEELRQRLESQVAGLRGRMAELRGEMSRRGLPDTLTGPLTGLLDEAGRLLEQAEAALKAGDANTAVSLVGKATALINEVAAKLKVLVEAFRRVEDIIERVLEKISEVRGEAGRAGLPPDTLQRVNQLLEEAASLVNRARAAASRGEFSEAHAYLARAQAAVNQAEALVKSGREGRSEKRGDSGKTGVQLEVEVEGRSIRVKIENVGSIPITIISIRVTDASGNVVSVEWGKGCTGTIQPGDKIKCVGTGNFRAGSPYTITVQYKPADTDKTETVTATSTAKRG